MSKNHYVTKPKRRNRSGKRKDTRRIALSLNILRTSPPAYPPPAPATSLFAAIILNLRPNSSFSPKRSSPDDERAAP